MQRVRVERLIRRLSVLACRRFREGTTAVKIQINAVVNCWFLSVIFHVTSFSCFVALTLCEAELTMGHSD
jgi:hypothetical protein